MLFKLAIMNKYKEIDIAKILYVWLTVVERQNIDITKCIPEELNLIINLVRVYDRDGFFNSILGDLFDVTTYFCKAVGLHEMNKSLI